MKEKKETGSRKNGRLGSRKSARRIPKGLIHVQASFNNTIVTVTDVRGRVVYWASAGTCGFRGTRRGTPFAAQTAAGNAIRTVVEQGTQRAEVMKKGPGLGIPSSKVRSHGARRPFDDLLLMSSPSVPSLLNIPTILYPIPGKDFVLKCR